LLDASAKDFCQLRLANLHGVGGKCSRSPRRTDAPAERDRAVSLNSRSVAAMLQLAAALRAQNGAVTAVGAAPSHQKRLWLAAKGVP